ncbi:hypothetical protein Taro_031206, partial [Colocasia esculenta]|nr:hypothetical protein [Colocasia esculenta]
LRLSLPAFLSLSLPLPLLPSEIPSLLHSSFFLLPHGSASVWYQRRNVPRTTFAFTSLAPTLATPPDDVCALRPLRGPALTSSTQGSTALRLLPPPLDAAPRARWEPRALARDAFRRLATQPRTAQCPATFPWSRFHASPPRQPASPGALPDPRPRARPEIARNLKDDFDWSQAPQIALEPVQEMDDMSQRI